MSRVPGTFKSPIARLVRDLSPEGAQAERMVLDLGAIVARRYTLGECTVLVAREPSPPNGYRWHLSIGHHSRYPTWDEIKSARYLAPELEDVKLMAQLLPKLNDEREWVNLNDNVFHLHEMREA